ncbi:glyoxylate/hydroxypyruvate reductase A [Brevirhabdus pacifica]|uniref:Glyoxylate/hydroxypyruvate reductase A n=1 Tax=Brevirhabdus pacifica TaxID=1267768 RepID=A0A1U7DGL6_9RHOB|nr:glyoxylate/hydroxypyruvate reductase A [Brevirhabdus pacifica]APX89137.1 glyoxylate/hydroxypyruvate reductase A [Brevirhabdus pacifica]OWU76804.1 hydroxyacid dehydrogenase [Loktanella sp. 22II-4b]PJJ86271.1 glyoxylate/hydroxypyruvate reductase A [Brevirhabdus pacifica]
MSVLVLYAGSAEQWGPYRPALTRAFEAEGLDVELVTEVEDPATVDYIVHSPSGPIRDFTPYTGAKAVLSLWAGVEEIVGNATLTQPLVRMVDAGLTEGMVEWVTGHVLRHHLGMDDHILNQDGTWRPVAPPLARQRRVALLGLGALGSAVGQALAALNFQVTGWSRSAHEVPGLQCLSGDEGLEATLKGADFVILLLPLTPQTIDVMNARTMALPTRGAVILNPGRGPLIDDAALLKALEDGQIGHATLDVFRTEPLPPEHPFWAHPKVTVTPHIASETRPVTAALAIAANIRRSEDGEPMMHVVDRARGY